MAKKARENKKQVPNNIYSVNKVHTDNSPVSQPEGTARFLLNAVDNTLEGDVNFVSNEESNKLHCKIKNGYIVLGYVAINDGDIIVFSVSRDEEWSEIGIINVDDTYSTLINAKLDFKITNQINAVFRLRRGCERIIYWTDPEPNQVNIDDLDNYKDSNGNFIPKKFKLFKGYNNVPVFQEIIAKDNGNLEPGSYNISIQYLDADLNPTNWITSSPVINIYNDSVNKTFYKIEGSINSEEEVFNFPNTTKSIYVNLGNLDNGYTFYRLAFAEASTGTGIVNTVKVTAPIPITANTYEYTGDNYQITISEKELLQQKLSISSAKYIEQLENILVLGNIKGSQVKVCLLQQYASQITTDAISKKVAMSIMSDSNPKKPTVHFDGVGYMPGEIYSIGIVYVFDDGEESPVYHIPGKNPNVADNIIFDTSYNGQLYPMSKNNESVDDIYYDNDNCDVLGYWGNDSEGRVLKNKRVRHHRFPFRKDIELPMLEKSGGNSSNINVKQLIFKGTGTIQGECTQDMIDAGECTTLYTPESFSAKLTYDLDGMPQELFLQFNPYTIGTGYQIQLIATSNEFVGISNNYKIYETDNDGYYVEVLPGTESPRGITYSRNLTVNQESTSEINYNANILGFHFSNIIIPPEKVIGKSIIGYYFVRNERKESDKTILASGVMTRGLVKDEYQSVGWLSPNIYSDSLQVYSKKIWGLIYPEYLFENKKYTVFDRIVQQGNFAVTKREYSKFFFNDVAPGSSYDKEVHKGGSGKDDDGWSLKCITRDNELQYSLTQPTFNKSFTEFNNIQHLTPLESYDKVDGNILYNVSADNKTCLLELNYDFNISSNWDIPYVYVIKDIANNYTNFRTENYIKMSKNIHLVGNNTNNNNVFGGDTHINPMKYVTSLFVQNMPAKRAIKTNVWTIVLGAALIVIGIVAAIFTATASTVLTVWGVAIIAASTVVASYGVSTLSSGIKLANITKAYNEDYDKGLRDTILYDHDAKYEYDFLPCDDNGIIRSCDTAADDEIRWIAEAGNNLWFESQINIGVRHGYENDEAPDFIPAPGRVQSGNTAAQIHHEFFGLHRQKDDYIAPVTDLDKHMVRKLLVPVDTETAEDGFKYLGHVVSEYYSVNKDYDRLNSQKVYFHLPLAYDCCSDCIEEFPHRIIYSQQSFQEELIDNFRIFLPNNFRDIEGNKGVITGLHRFMNKLYINTEEAFWELVQNFQERVTDDIVSFIGTGSYFAIPPRLIKDNKDTTAGCTSDTSIIKTEHGIFFFSTIEGKVYLFDGKQLADISIGNTAWFKNNKDYLLDKEYFKKQKRHYPYINNISNRFGIGYVSAYDSRKERFLLTKLDFKLPDELNNISDYEIVVCNDNLYVFNDYQQTIDNMKDDGWNYSGIHNCEMLFYKQGYTTEAFEEIVTRYEPTEYDLHIFYDTTGKCFDTTISANPARELLPGETLGAKQQSIDDTITDALASINATNNVIRYADSTGRWLRHVETVKNYYNNNVSDKKVVIINIIGDANPVYHDDSLNTICGDEEGGPDEETPTTFSVTPLVPTSSYIDDTMYLNNGSYENPMWDDIQVLNIPVVMSHTDCDLSSQINLYNILGATGYVPGVTIAGGNIDGTFNPAIPSARRYSMRNAVYNCNNYPYSSQLRHFNFRNVLRANTYGDINNIVTIADIITTISDYFTPTIVHDTVIVYKEIPNVETTTISPTLLNIGNIVNNSWTVSFSAKKGNEGFMGWHSYMPNIYLTNTNKLLTWINNIVNNKADIYNNIWEHNVLNNYQTFYDKQYPHIIEFIINKAHGLTKIYDWIEFQTTAKKYDTNTEDYYDSRFDTFNKVIIYNSRQSTGLLNMKVKDVDTNDSDYLQEQVTNTTNNIIIDINEKNWTINDFRDIVSNLGVSLFNKSLDARQSEYFIDKVINNACITGRLDWYESEIFRDKYLTVRLIFDNKFDTQLTTKFAISSENKSFR